MKVEAGRGDQSDSIVLDVQQLTKVFGSGRAAVRAVEGVDLTARRGELILIVGPSGSGKTTLLTMIGGLLRPTSGSVRINGLEIADLSESQLTRLRRHSLGFVFQNFNLLESLNSRENVEAALNFAGVRGKRARQRAEQLLVDLGMGNRMRAKTNTLSGGERQRVSIARAIANDPEIILADEPTANLDSHRGHEVVVLLRDIAKQQQRTVIIASHDQRVREVADRVLRLQDGHFQEIDEADSWDSVLEPAQIAPTARARLGQETAQSGTSAELDEGPGELRRWRLRPEAMPILGAIVIISVVLLFVYAILHGASASNDGGSAAQRDGGPGPNPTSFDLEARFVCPLDGATVANPVIVRMAVAGVRYTPAANPARVGEGHLDLIIDGPAPSPGQAVPKDDTHIHLDDGAYVTTLPSLTPGRHVLTLAFVLSSQVLMSAALTDTVNVTVAGASDQVATPNCLTP